MSWPENFCYFVGCLVTGLLALSGGYSAVILACPVAALLVWLVMEGFVDRP